jgi:hypothetical protein
MINPYLKTAKIRDVISDRMLAPKFEVQHLAVA